ACLHSSSSGVPRTGHITQDGVSLVFGFLIKEPKEPKQAWRYTPFRSNASMFWWLYYADNPSRNFTELPLIMWLQGGPGASGCGYGNFEEIGPLDVDLKPRRTTWPVYTTKVTTS
uniref:Serine carboxypeptidase n=1 Tax=Varanus komodoensis TaxID=61221 RepID=A0A8D2Q5Q5_VARKO